MNKIYLTPEDFTIEFYKYIDLKIRHNILVTIGHLPRGVNPDVQPSEYRIINLEWSTNGDNCVIRVEYSYKGRMGIYGTTKKVSDVPIIHSMIVSKERGRKLDKIGI